MGRERVAKPMRMAKQPSHRARVETPAAHGQEEGVVCAGRQRRSSRLQVARELERGLLAEGHDALFTSLSADVHQLPIEVDVDEIERDRLLAPQPRRVEELEEGAVPEGERRVAVDELEQLVDLGALRGIGEAPRTVWRERCLRDGRGAEREADTGTHCGEAPRDRGRREPVPATPELGDPVGEDAGVDSVECQCAALEVRRERAEVGAVRALRCGREPAMLEEAVDRSVRGHTRPIRRRAVAACLTRARGVAPTHPQL